MDKPERSCVRCGLPLPEDYPEAYRDHLDSGTCADELRRAMLAQRKAAQELGLIISTRFLTILEEMSLHPMVQEVISFTVVGPDGAPHQLEPGRVAGLFAAIRHLYEKMGDFSPLRDAQEKAARAEAHAAQATARSEAWSLRAGLVTGMLLRFAAKYKAVLTYEDREMARQMADIMTFDADKPDFQERLGKALDKIDPKKVYPDPTPT